MQMNVYRVATPDGVKDYLSYMPHDWVTKYGLPPQAIAGVLLRELEEEENITPDVFARNRIFVEFLHEVIARRGPELPGLVKEAQIQMDGWVYIIDRQVPDLLARIPPEDILGGFEVRNGEIVPNSYEPCPKHVILSSQHGFAKLGTELDMCLLEELKALCTET